ncbi:MAG: glutamate racemase [Chitinivibrionales bacterium]|nr:glutamate racemase [Chitinivibrionales bacterium]
MSDARPVGIFDSGLGGLTVVKELVRLMPGEELIYLGDTARFPYGGRSDETIRNLGLQDAKFLLKRDIKMIVVACNTVSSVALEYLRESVHDIPVIGVVLPGARAAVFRTAEKKIGVIGTAATIRTQSYVKAIHDIDPDIKVFFRACPLFAPLVEDNLYDSEIARMVAQHYIYQLVDNGIDCLILGCTHYPLLMEVIQGVVGSRVELIDSALWAAKEAQDILTALDACNPRSTGGLEGSTFFITDLTPGFSQGAQIFLGQKLNKIEKIELEKITG